jgi:hypothetical protein
VEIANFENVPKTTIFQQKSAIKLLLEQDVYMELRVILAFVQSFCMRSFPSIHQGSKLLIPLLIDIVVVVFFGLVAASNKSSL